MPVPEDQGREVTCLVFDKSGYDSYGRPQTAEPREITCRIELERRVVRDAQNRPVTLDASAINLSAAIAPGSQFWVGTSDDWYGTGSGSGDVEIYEVVTYDEVPDMRGRETYREAGLQRARSSPSEA